MPHGVPPYLKDVGFVPTHPVSGPVWIYTDDLVAYSAYAPGTV
jgi:hypothetical protein